jgi:hypothetical protein
MTHTTRPTPPADAEQRARELLAAAYDRCGLRGSYYIANPDAPKPDVTDEPEYMVVEAACSAIVAALSQQPEARGVVDVEAIRRACESGKRFWKSGPGYYEEIESLLPALTEVRL